MAHRFALRTVAALAGLAALTLPALADPAIPSYATSAESIHGTIASINGADLYLNDDRGFVDHVVLRDRTIVNPSGSGLAPDLAVTIVGRADGSVFRADEIEIVASSSASGADGSGYSDSGGYADGPGYGYDAPAYPYYPYYPYYGYGWPYFSTSFYFGSHGGGYYPHGGYPHGGYPHGGYPHGGYPHGGYVPHGGGFSGPSRGTGGFSGGGGGSAASGHGGGGGGGHR